MILLLFIVAIIAIVLIARYNEDDRLFWKLLISFCVAFATTSVIYNIIDDGDRNKVSCIKTDPMQLSNCTSGQQVLLGDVSTLINVDTETMSVAAGKDNLFLTNIAEQIPNEIYANVRDQPPMFINYFIDTS